MSLLFIVGSLYVSPMILQISFHRHVTLSLVETHKIFLSRPTTRGKVVITKDIVRWKGSGIEH